MNSVNGRRVGVYGGSFDPPHVAHVLTAHWAWMTGALDEVVVVPSFAHPLKLASGASFEDRVAMCRLAFAQCPFVARVDTVEMTLGKSRSLDVVQAFKKAAPTAVFRWVIGADILAETHRWYRWDELCVLAPPLVIGRAGYASEPTSEEHKSQQTLFALPNVRSSDIRERVASGQPTQGLLPFRVREYIDTHHLYRREACLLHVNVDSGYTPA